MFLASILFHFLFISTFFYHNPIFPNKFFFFNVDWLTPNTSTNVLYQTIPHRQLSRCLVKLKTSFSQKNWLRKKKKKITCALKWFFIILNTFPVFRNMSHIHTSSKNNIFYCYIYLRFVYYAILLLPKTWDVLNKKGCICVKISHISYFINHSKGNIIPCQENCYCRSLKTVNLRSTNFGQFWK